MPHIFGLFPQGSLCEAKINKAIGLKPCSVVVLTHALKDVVNDKNLSSFRKEPIIFSDKNLNYLSYYTSKIIFGYE